MSSPDNDAAVRAYPDTRRHHAAWLVPPARLRNACMAWHVSSWIDHTIWARSRGRGPLLPASEECRRFIILTRPVGGDFFILSESSLVYAQKQFHYTSVKVTKHQFLIIASNHKEHMTYLYTFGIAVYMSLATQASRIRKFASEMSASLMGFIL